MLTRKGEQGPWVQMLSISPKRNMGPDLDVAGQKELPHGSWPWLGSYIPFHKALGQIRRLHEMENLPLPRTVWMPFKLELEPLEALG